MTATDFARQSFRGSLIILVGNFLSAGLSAVAVVIVARLLGPGGYGIYTLALIVPSLLQLFAGLGANIAVTRYSAYHISTGRPDEARRFTHNAISFIFLSGAALSVANFFLAGPLSTLILHRPELAPYVQWASLSVIGVTLVQATTSSAIGWKRMGLASITQVVQSVFKLLLAPILVVAGFGIFGAIMGHVVSFLLAGVFGMLSLYFAKLRGPSSEVSHFGKDVIEMIGYGLPAYAGLLVVGLAGSYATLVLAAIAPNAVVGFYQAAQNLASPFTLVSAAVASALFPAFVSLDGVGGDMKSAFSHSIKYVAFFITPIIMFVISTSDLLIMTFYGPSFSGSAPFLRLLAASYLPLSLGYTVLPVFFNGVGRTRLTMLSLLAGALALAVAAPLLAITLSLGVNGLILSLLISNLVSLLVGAALAWKMMQISLKVWEIGAVLLASLVSYAGVILVPRFSTSNYLDFLLDFVVFFIVYLSIAPLFRSINEQDLDVLQLTLKEVGVIGKLSAPVIRYERLMVRLVH